MITRNNYEEFFLLYVDNELSAAERQAVEEFVGANPDLREEWELTLQCRIAPDEQIVFGGKDALRLSATAPAIIHTGNHEEYFIAYIDGELDGTSRDLVEEYLRLHPTLLPEFIVLQQATFTPDLSIVFPDKESLYKKEKDRRFILLPWGRIAAAAITVGAIVLLIFRSGQGTHSTGTAETGLAQHGEKASHKKEPGSVTPQTPDTLYDGRTLSAAAAPKDSTAGSGSRSLAAATASSIKKNRPNTPVATTRVSSPNDLNAPDDSRNISLPGNRTLAQTRTDAGPDESEKRYSDPSTNRLAVLDPATAQRPDKMMLPTDRIITGESQTTLNKNSTFATQALLAGDGEETEDGLSNEGPPQKKSKFRGFFRKVSRVLEKTTSRDEDDKHNVLIGGFQFALK